MEHKPPEEPKYSEIQNLVMTSLEEKGITTSRVFEEKIGISHAMFGRYKEMKSMMSLDKMEQIFSKYPDLKIKVADYLRGNTEENITDDVKKFTSKDEQLLDLYKYKSDHLASDLALAKAEIQKLKKRLGEDTGTKKKTRPSHNQ